MTQPDLSHLGGSDGGKGTNCPDVFEHLVTKYDLCSVIDVGCGEGTCSRWWHDRGLYVLGVDGYPPYIEQNQLPPENLRLHDYTEGPFMPDMVFDLGWSSEFVEHVEEKYVFNFLTTFARCKHVCLTFATPGQGGHHHVNEQLEAYWIDKMGLIGFDLDRPETEWMRDTGRNVAYGRRTLTFFTARQSPLPAAKEEMRYEYPLTPESIVLDAGGYQGNFCRPFVQKYGCRVHVFEPVLRFCQSIKGSFTPAEAARITVHPFGLSSLTATAEFHVQNDSSGAFAGSPDVETVQLMDIRQIFSELQLDRVDLLKLNIEGGEYAVLEAMIEADLLRRVRFLQIQWHGPSWCASPFPGTEERRRKIKGKLFQTHRPMWETPWVWESFELRT